MKTFEDFKKLISEHPDWGRPRLARALERSSATIQDWMNRSNHLATPPIPKTAKAPTPETLENLALSLLQRSATTPKSLAESLGISLDEVGELLKNLQEQYNVTCAGGVVRLDAPPFGRLEIASLGNEWVKVGLVADTHLCCEEERLAELHNTYDLFQKEGIDTVFHAGNIVDGYVQKINGASVKCTTVDDQVQYVINNYPKRNKICTHFITGDDHEGWWIKEGFNFGKYLEMTAEEQGRTDLQYIGHVESDIEYKTKNGSAVMKIQHPGGGSSYARSYTQQKTIESFEGGEKPDILVQGHYHVSNFMQDRNVYVVGMPGFQDQTVFARKKRLRMEVGSAILEFMQSPHDGSITRCRLEFIRYFTRGYYKPFLRSDAIITKGHLTIQRGSK